MASTQSLLEEAAQGGSIAESDWSRVREYILEQLDISTTEFPSPRAPTQPVPLVTRQNHALPSSPVLKNDHLSTQDTDATDKENAPPSGRSVGRASSSLPGADMFAPTPYIQPNPRDTIATYLNGIRQILTEDFPNSPPYTIQRLAELILYPKRHYRHLSPYLQAVHRVVGVSSTATAFPSTTLTSPNLSVAMLNGVLDVNLALDDTLGGAILSPITWLTNRSPSPAAHDSPQSLSRNLLGSDRDLELQSESTEIVDGPNGASSIETVSVISPTSNGPLGSNGLASSLSSHSTSSDTESAALTPEEEIPHARGPEEIGVEDTGIVSNGGLAGILASQRESEDASAAAEDDSKMDVDKEGD